MHGDVRDMHQIESGSIDVAFDKGTFDAMIYGSPWSPPDEVLDNTSRYIQEVRLYIFLTLHECEHLTFLTLQVFRVLKPDGRFLYITYRQPHFVKPLLNCNGVNWNTTMEVLGDSKSSFDYFGFVLQKATPSIQNSANAKTGEAGPS